jgi:hypothetical protein
MNSPIACRSSKGAKAGNLKFQISDLSIPESKEPLRRLHFQPKQGTAIMLSAPLRLRASNSHTPRSAPGNANPPLGPNRQPPNHALFHLSSFRIHHVSYFLSRSKRAKVGNLRGCEKIDFRVLSRPIHGKTTPHIAPDSTNASTRDNRTAARGPVGSAASKKFTGSQISNLKSQIPATLNAKNHFAASIFNPNRAPRSCSQRSLRLRASNSHTPRSPPWNANPPLGPNRQPPNHAPFHHSSFRIHHSSERLQYPASWATLSTQGRELQQRGGHLWSRRDSKEGVTRGVGADYR